jgi:hypothetical protein
MIGKDGRSTGGHFASPLTTHGGRLNAELPRPNLTERIAILLEVDRCEVVDKRRPPACAFRNQATDRAERPRARWTGMLRVPGFQVPREVYPSTSLPVPVRSSGSSNVISMSPSVIISRHGSFTTRRFGSRYETVFVASASDTAPTGDRAGRPFRWEPVSRSGAFRATGSAFTRDGIVTKSNAS